jgi:hypothetical protein
LTLASVSRTAAPGATGDGRSAALTQSTAVASSALGVALAPPRAPPHFIEHLERVRDVLSAAGRKTRVRRRRRRRRRGDGVAAVCGCLRGEGSGVRARGRRKGRGWRRRPAWRGREEAYLAGAGSCCTRTTATAMAWRRRECELRRGVARTAARRGCGRRRGSDVRWRARCRVSIWGFPLPRA